MCIKNKLQLSFLLTKIFYFTFKFLRLRFKLLCFLHISTKPLKILSDILAQYQQMVNLHFTILHNIQYMSEKDNYSASRGTQIITEL